MSFQVHVQGARRTTSLTWFDWPVLACCQVTFAVPGRHWRQASLTFTMTCEGCVQGSPEVDAAGDPYGFPAPTIELQAPATSVLFSTQMTQNRSQEQLQELVVSLTMRQCAWPLRSHLMQLPGPAGDGLCNAQSVPSTPARCCASSLTAAGQPLSGESCAPSSDMTAFLAPSSDMTSAPQDGRFLSNSTSRLLLRLATYNAKRGVFGIVRITVAWTGPGDITSTMRVHSLAVSPYLTAHSR